MSILLYGSGYWNEVINFPALVRHGTIAESDLELFKFADDPTTAFELLRDDLTRRYLLPEEPLPEGEQETPAIAKSRDPEDATVQK
jgi:predicted Rossmann-fold nucleotide-binding protein